MRLVWLPNHHEAAITISDDPDNSSFAAFKTMYDFLAEIGFLTTRAMWVYPKKEFTGTPPLPIEFASPLLSDPECLDYCEKLSAKGFEFCLHGASCGNNERQRTLDALSFLDRRLGPSPVFICHSKNAENLYWDAKVVENRLMQHALRTYDCNECFGEVASSKYFWGDVCRQQIRFIRLFRTRALNTLAVNPSMPYHDFGKPLVNYWFSATKGYIPRLFTKENIDSLCQQNGAGILYQYLHKYIDAHGKVPTELAECLRRVAADERIWKATVSEVLERLRRFQLVVARQFQGELFIINAGRSPIENVQIQLDRPEDFNANVPFGFTSSRCVAILRRLDPLSVIRIASGPMDAHPPVSATLDRLIFKFPFASVLANTGRQQISLSLGGKDITLQPMKVHVEYRNEDAQRLEILKPVGGNEINRLIATQTFILMREHLFLGRKRSVLEYLKKPGKVESQANW